MNPDRFARLKELFLEASGLSETDRPAFLLQVCQDDPELGQEVAALLAQDGGTWDFLEPEFDLVRALHAAAPSESLPDGSGAWVADGDLEGLSMLSPPDQPLRPTPIEPEMNGPQPGQIFADRYEVQAEIGRGGFGVVYRAFDGGPLQRPVAIKWMAAPAGPPEQMARERERLLREARLAASLSHPGIATIFDAAAQGGFVYITQELAPGRDLGRLLAEEGPLPVRRALSVIRQVCEALAHAHERGVIHRDIKPGNILVGPDDGVKVTDFGIAQSARDEAGEQGFFAGTPGYMAPDQIRGERVDARADLFSTACVLYQALTGRAPFEGATRRSIVDKTLHLDPPAPTHVRRDLPRSFDRILNRALSKRREDRYENVAAFLQELLSYEQFESLTDPESALAALVPALEQGTCVFFLGLRLPVDGSERFGKIGEVPGSSRPGGKPDPGGSGTEVTDEDLLADCLAQRLEVAGERDLPRLAQMLETARGRGELIRTLSAAVRQPWISTREAIRRLARLPLGLVVTTRYDDCLEEEMRRGGRPARRVRLREEVVTPPLPDDGVRTHPRTSPSEPTRDVILVPLFGSPADRSSLVVTEEDLWRFFGSFQSLPDFLKSALATRTLVFVGYDPVDPNFRHLFLEIAGFRSGRTEGCFLPASRHSLSALAWAERKGLRLIECEAGRFLELLEDRLADRRRSAAKAPIPLRRALPSRPYKFLNHYEPSDEAIFFGRDAEKERVLSRIHAYPLNLLYAPSGSGKTSLIQAGLMPALRRDGYCPIYVRVFQDPGSEIASAAAEAAELPKGDSRPFGEVLEAAAEKTGTPVVVFLDQFEEFFIRFDKAVRDRFVGALSACLTQGKGRIRLVLSLREDFLARLSELQGLIPTIFHNQFRMTRLSEEASRIAMVEPARLLGLEVEPELVDRLIADLELDGIDPPQLQIVCDALYESAGIAQKRLTLRGYDSLGGTRGILSGYLERTLQEFPPDDRRMTRELLKALVTSEETKAVTESAELARRLGRPPEATERALTELVRRRLVRRIPRGDGYWFELSHEYLVQEITRWLSEKEREFQKVRELLDQALRAHRQLGLLMSAPQIRIIHAHEDDLSLQAEERKLLRASEDALKRRRKNTILVAAGLGLGVVLVSLGWRYAYLATHRFLEPVDREMFDAGPLGSRRMETICVYQGAPGRSGLDLLLGFPRLAWETDLDLSQIEPAFREKVKGGLPFGAGTTAEDALFRYLKPSEQVRYLVLAGNKERAIELFAKLASGTLEQDQDLNRTIEFLVLSGVTDERFLKPALEYAEKATLGGDFASGVTSLERPFASTSGEALRKELVPAFQERGLQTFALILSGLTGAPGDTAHILPFLRDPDPVVRDAAIEALRDLGSTASRGAVVASSTGPGDLDWSEPAVATWMDRCGIGAYGSILRREVENAHLPAWRKGHLLAHLALQEPAITLPLIRDLLANAHWEKQELTNCLSLLIDCADPGVDPVLREASRSHDRTVALIASVVLAARGDPDASPILKGFLDEPDAWEAIVGLGMFRGAGVRQSLLRIVAKSPPREPRVVAAALHSLRWYNDAEVVEVLTHALEGSVPETRQAAEDALVAQATPEARAALRKTARGPNPIAAVYAAEGLERLDEPVEPKTFLDAISRKEVYLDYEAYMTAVGGLRDAWLKSPLDAPLSHADDPVQSVRLAALLALLEHPEKSKLGREGAFGRRDQAPGSQSFWIRYRWAVRIAARAESLRAEAKEGLEGGDASRAASLLDRSERVLGVWGDCYPAAGLSAALRTLSLRTERSDSAWVEVDLRLGDVEDAHGRLGRLLQWNPALRAAAAKDPRFVPLRNFYWFRIMTGMEPPAQVD